MGVTRPVSGTEICNRNVAGLENLELQVTVSYLEDDRDVIRANIRSQMNAVATTQQISCGKQLIRAKWGLVNALWVPRVLCEMVPRTGREKGVEGAPCSSWYGLGELDDAVKETKDESNATPLTLPGIRYQVGCRQLLDVDEVGYGKTVSPEVNWWSYQGDKSISPATCYGRELLLRPNLRGGLAER